MAAHVLVVEDHAETRERMVEMLSAGAEPFNVTAVATCHAALAQLRGAGAACVLLDCILPDAEDLEALHRIRAAHPDLPVVVMTAEGSEEIAVAAMKAGARDYVVKHGAYLGRLLAATRAVLARGALARANARVASGLLIGREAESEQLRNALTGCRLGRGRVVLIGGDPGIGKSALALHVADEAKRHDCDVVWGRCHETAGAPPYWPWIQALRALGRARVPAGVPAPEWPGGNDLAALLHGASVRPDAAPFPPPSDSDAARFRLFDAVATALTSAGRRRPLVVLIDDLHGADAPSIQLLQFLAREIADAPVLVVATHRDAGGAPPTASGERLAIVRREPNCITLPLRGLSEPAVRELLGAIAGHDISADFAHAFYERTEGNPLFVHEIARHLVEEGILYYDGEQWTSRFTPEELPVPQGAREVIRRRLAHVSGACREALATAAVIGREFDAAAVARLAAAPGVAEALSEAVEAQVLVRLPSTAGGLRFAHPLIREILYDDLPAARRIDLHRRVGELLAALPDAEREARVAELAHHFCEAAPGGAVERAVAYARQAAAGAAASMAHEVAARHYEMALRALRLAGADDPTARGALLLLLAEARWRAGEFDRAKQAAAQALELARRADAPEALARAALCYAAPLQGFGAVVCDEAVVALLDEALCRLDPRDSALRAALMARLAEELSMTADDARRTQLARAAIAMARRLDDPAVLGAVLRSTHWALWEPSAAAQRLALADELRALATRGDDAALQLDSQLFRVWALFELGGAAETRRELARAAQLARALRQDYYHWLLATTRVCWAYAEGALERVEPLLGDSLAGGETAPNANAALFAGVQHGHRLWLSGRFDELTVALQAIAERYPLLMPSVLCALAITASERGRDGEARRLFDQLAAHDFDDLPRNVTWLANLASLAEVCAALRDAPRAEQLSALLAPFTGRTVALPPIVVWASVAYYQGLLAATLGRWSEAARHFEAGLATDAAMGRRHWVARGQVAYADTLLRAGAPDAARIGALLDAAAATARELDMPALLARATALRAAPAAASGPPVGHAGPARRRATFRRDSDIWTIGADDRLVHYKAAVGMTRIQYLLQNPATYVSAVDLVRLCEGNGGSAVPPLPQRDAEAHLDSRAKREIYERLRTLASELDEAEAAGDRGTAEGLRAERERILDIVRESTGLHGRDRLPPTARERARQAVCKSKKELVDKLSDALPALARHIEAHVRTGADCVYLPDPEHPIDWEF